ncbi:hypothetical protein OB13_20130 [Pontibacter sp. HJ8]
MRRNGYLTALFLLLLVLAIPAATAQQPDTTATLIFRHSLAISSPTTISVDQNGSVYLMGPKRNLYKLDSLGQPLQAFSPPSRGRITAVEAWNPMKLLLFYEDRQELVLLDRFMSPIGTTRLSDLNYTGNVRAATLTPDDSFWLFNESDFTLSKIDLRYQKAVVETPLDLILDKARFDVRFVREYQNLVYLLDYNAGIYVFDNLGNYKKKLPFTGLAYMGFSGHELYFVKDNQLHFFDLYELKGRTLNLPAGKAYVSALVSSNFLYLFTKDQADAYTWKR